MPPAKEGAHQDGTAKDLKSWWSRFSQKKPKEPAPLGPPTPAPGSIFGIPLTTSIKYANVAISLMQEDGGSYTYGYIPIVVAKCGVFLKDKAIEVEGIFRLAGSARRMNQLQEIFNTQPTYGKNLDWTGYTVHDAANVLRRYLNNLPEPIVPLGLYEDFRTPLRQHQMQAVGNMEAKESDIGNFDYDETIHTYRSLIKKLPPLNRQLLLYILDMLAIFAAKSNVNHMTAANLAVIFQPGMLHHPAHDKLPHEYRLSQDVVIFLIDQQDNFLLGMPGTAADEKTKQEIEAGPPAPVPAPAPASAVQPGTPTRAAGVHRSVSTNSRSTNSSRLAGIRRNISVSSKASKNSQHNVPATPGTPGTPGVHRSNTVPSRRSPVVGQNRFNKPNESPSATPDATVSPASPAVTPAAVTPAVATPAAATPAAATPAAVTAAAATATGAAATATTAQTSDTRTESNAPSISQASAAATARDQSKERLLGEPSSTQPANASRRGLAGLLRPQISDDGQGRQPNKLRKKRYPSGAQPSGHSSAASLSADPENARSPFTSPLQDPITSGDEGLQQVTEHPSNGAFALTETAPTPRTANHPDAEALKGPHRPSTGDGAQPSSETATLKPKPEHNPTVDDQTESNADTTDASIGPDPESEKKEKKKRWRFSVSAKKNQEEKHQQQMAAAQGSSSRLTSASEAEQSKTSGASSAAGHRRSSAANHEKPMLTDLNNSSGRRSSKDITSTEERSPTEAGEKGKGPIGWFRQKIAERKEKDEARDRAKSPKRNENTGHGPSSTNLDTVANGENASRQKGSDMGETLPDVKEESRPPTTAAATSVPQAEPVKASAGVAKAPEATSKESVFHTSSIEDYMADSDREKLATAREVQAYLTKQDEEEKARAASASAAAKNATAALPANIPTSSIAVDPALASGEAAAEATEEITTPKPGDIKNLVTDGPTVAKESSEAAKPVAGGENAAA